MADDLVLLGSGRLGLPVRAIRKADGWCDDPAHPDYNTLVRLPFAASHEEMWRADGLYDLVVELGYNDAPPEGFLFSSWVPGLEPAEFPAGTGMFLPKGSKFNFEMHYTTNGEEQSDRSEMGLYLSKAPAERRLNA